jgi:hypothetical protein
MAMQVGDVVQETMAIITGRRKKNKKKTEEALQALIWMQDVEPVSKRCGVVELMYKKSPETSRLYSSVSKGGSIIIIPFLKETTFVVIFLLCTVYS